MRTISIPKCTYAIYASIMAEIMKKTPFAVINTDYRADISLATISFWDSDYIPEALSVYRLDPPAHEPVDLTGIDLPPIEK